MSVQESRLPVMNKGDEVWHVATKKLWKPEPEFRKFPVFLSLFEY